MQILSHAPTHNPRGGNAILKVVKLVLPQHSTLKGLEYKSTLRRDLYAHAYTYLFIKQAKSGPAKAGPAGPAPPPLNPIPQPKETQIAIMRTYVGMAVCGNLASWEEMYLTRSTA